MLAPLHGWSRRGERAHLSAPRNRGKKDTTLLASMSSEGTGPRLGRSSSPCRTATGSREITEAENKAEAKKAVKEFAEEFGVKWPKAVEKVTNDKGALLSYYDYPAEHWGGTLGRPTR